MAATRSSGGATPQSLGTASGRPSTRRVVLAGVAAATLSASCKPSARRKATRLLVGSGAGGSPDMVARLFARRLEEMFDEPVGVENEPRAGGKLVAERLAVAQPDGSTLAVVPSGLLYASLLREPGVRWDLARFGWLGSFSKSRRVLITTARSGATSFEELLRLDKPLLAPAVSASSPGYYEPLIVNHLTGARIKPVPGFVGGARTLAFVGGEVDAIIGSLDALQSVLELEGSRVILRMNDLPLPNGRAVPTLAEVSRGPDAEILLPLVGAHALLGRIAALPPGAPADVLEHWRGRFNAVVSDPWFRRAAAEQGHGIEATRGEIVAEMMTALLSSRAATTREALVRALNCGLAAQRPDCPVVPG